MGEFQEHNTPKETEPDKNYRRTIQINGMRPEDLYNAMVKKKIERSIDADETMRSRPEYFRSFYNKTDEAFADWQVKNPEQINLVWLSVSDLGFDRPTNIKEIYAAAHKRGLELCPPSTVGYLSLMLSENPLSAGEYYKIATELLPRDDYNTRDFKLFTLDQIDQKGEDVYISSTPVRPETTLEPPNREYPVTLFEPKEQFVFVEPDHQTNGQK